MALDTIQFTTNMGSVDATLGHPLNFLTDKEKADIDEIGYSGKLYGEPMNRTEYLNTLGKGVFSILQTKWDNGDFKEKFVLSRAY